jgi:pantoate--beta-alanine ligase
MQVISTIAALRTARAGLAAPVGLVPTMGALHAGHAALIRSARRSCASVVVTIFVNPAQFGPREDLSRYPRPLENDLRLCRENGADIVFTPSAGEIYPDGESTRVDPGAIGSVLEGKSRPGHFTGVATVVSKLFILTKPDVAYFGEKDAQQVRVVRRIARDLLFDLRIEVVPTVREADGLALSSRNVYLPAAGRKAAPDLHRALQAARAAWLRGERRGESLRAAALAILQETPGAVVDYVSVADPETLAELVTVDGPALVSLAVRIGETRLIDNITLTS